MAVLRDNPYADFNFLVDLGGGDPNGVDAGFSEVTGLGESVSVIEYRNGNERTNATRKLPGLVRTQEIRLRRGVIGSTTLFDWMKKTTDGQPEYRNVRITLLDENRNPVVTWNLSNAIPIKYSGPTLSAGTSAVAIEELVLACQSMAMA